MMGLAVGEIKAQHGKERGVPTILKTILAGLLSWYEHGRISLQFGLGRRVGRRMGRRVEMVRKALRCRDCILWVAGWLGGWVAVTIVRYVYEVMAGGRMAAVSDILQ